MRHVSHYFLIFARFQMFLKRRHHGDGSHQGLCSFDDTDIVVMRQNIRTDLERFKTHLAGVFIILASSTMGACQNPVLRFPGKASIPRRSNADRTTEQAAHIDIR
jgi:hypothetical protein